MRLQLKPAFRHRRLLDPDGKGGKGRWPPTTLAPPVKWCDAVSLHRKPLPEEGVAEDSWIYAANEKRVGGSIGGKEELLE